MVRDEARAIEVLEEFANARTWIHYRHVDFIWRKQAGREACRAEYEASGPRKYGKRLSYLRNYDTEVGRAKQERRRLAREKKVRADILAGVVPFKRGKLFQRLLRELGKVEEYEMRFWAAGKRSRIGKAA
jgi:hypothetical protein